MVFIFILPHITLDFIMSAMTVLEQTSELQNSRLKSFLDFFPDLKDNIIQIDLKSIGCVWIFR